MIVLHKTTNQKYTCGIKVKDKFSSLSDFLSRYNLGISFLNFHNKLVIACSYSNVDDSQRTYCVKAYVYDAFTGRVDDVFYDIFEERAVYINYQFTFDLVIMPFLCVSLIENRMSQLDADAIKTKVRQLFKYPNIGILQDSGLRILCPVADSYSHTPYITTPYTIYVRYHNFLSV